VAANPSPDRISDAWWWFMEQLVAMEPGTINSGVYANKAGYHNARNSLLARPEWRSDYSIRLAADKRGPGDKASAGDWTFPAAQAGDFSRIRVYGARIHEAFRRRDPRLKGWREVLIQADNDLQAEGYDFQTWTTRTPDATHAWHGHFSELREYIESYDNKRRMLTVLGWVPPEEDEMTTAYRIQSADTAYNGRVWLSNGVNRRGPIRAKGNIEGPALVGAVVKILTDAMRQSVSADPAYTWEHYLDDVAGPKLVVTPVEPAPHTHTVPGATTSPSG